MDAAKTFLDGTVERADLNQQLGQHCAMMCLTLQRRCAKPGSI